MKVFLMFLIVVFQLPKVEVIEKAKYKEYIAQGYTLVDVRTPDEFEAGHIDGAQNINVKSDAFVREIEKL